MEVVEGSELVRLDVVNARLECKRLLSDKTYFKTILELLAKTLREQAEKSTRQDIILKITAGVDQFEDEDVIQGKRGDC